MARPYTPRTRNCITCGNKFEIPKGRMNTWNCPNCKDKKREISKHRNEAIFKRSHV